jgi:hypothetical protein
MTPPDNGEMIATPVASPAGGEERGAVRRRASIGALLLVCFGVVLGATIFRSGIAHATGSAQRPTVAKADGKPEKSKSSTPNSRILVLEYDNGADDEKIAPIRANLITVQGDIFGSSVWLNIKGDGQEIMFFELQPSERVVLPLPKSVKIDEVDLSTCFGSIQCFAQVNIIGS